MRVGGGGAVLAIHHPEIAAAPQIRRNHLSNGDNRRRENTIARLDGKWQDRQGDSIRGATDDLDGHRGPGWNSRQHKQCGNKQTNEHVPEHGLRPMNQRGLRENGSIFRGAELQRQAFAKCLCGFAFFRQRQRRRLEEGTFDRAIVQRLPAGSDQFDAQHLAVG